MAKNRSDQNRFENIADSPDEPIRKMSRSFFQYSTAGRKAGNKTSGNLDTIVVHTPMGIVRLPFYPHISFDSKTSQIVFRQILDQKLKEWSESEPSDSYEYILQILLNKENQSEYKSFYFTYPVDPEKGITIIDPPSPKSDDDNPITVLPALGSLTTEDFEFFQACYGKGISNLDQNARDRFFRLFSELTSRLNERTNKITTKTETNLESESESEEKS